MSKFILILRTDPALRTSLSPAEIQEIVERYRNWARAQAGKVVMEGSYKLARTGRMMAAPGGKVTVKDGPYAETKDVIGGFFMVEAPDYEAAAAIAQTCPHLDDGSIEIRQTDS